MNRRDFFKRAGVVTAGGILMPWGELWVPKTIVTVPNMIPWDISTDLTSIQVNDIVQIWDKSRNQLKGYGIVTGDSTAGEMMVKGLYTLSQGGMSPFRPPYGWYDINNLQESESIVRIGRAFGEGQASNKT